MIPADAKSKKVPRLRFRGFSDEWEISALGNIAEIRTGPFGSLLHESDYVKKGTPIITVENLANGVVILLKTTPRVSDDDKKKLKSYVLRGGDIVFSRVGSVDRSAYVTHKSDGWLFSGRLLRVRSEINAQYLNAYLQREKSKNSIRNLAVGGTMPSLNTKLLGFAIVYYPLQVEQKKIAGFLGVVDDKISTLQSKKSALEKYKKGAMQQLFSQKIRFKPAHRSLGAVGDENGKDYPEWEDKIFGSIYSFLRTNSLSRAELSNNGSIKNIHYGDIHMRLATNFDSNKESIGYASEQNASDLCKEGDLVIADASEDRQDVGKAIEIIKTNGDNIVAGLHTFLARPLANSVAVGFSGYLMQSRLIRKQIMRIATGASVLGISKTQLSKSIFPLPTLEEQQKIADFLTSLDNKLNLIQKELEQAKQFKKALLQQMFV